jgi:hypothetical protein
MELMKRSTKIATVLAIAGLVLTNITGASAASKTITCYKGTTVKKVTAASPKCPAGYTTTAPKATTKAAAPAGKGGTVAINATYKGTVTMVWGDSDVNVTNVTATGSGNTGGLDSLKGMGAAAPAEQCTPFDGEGTLGSGADTLKVSYADGSMACAADADAPTTVTIKKGPLKIISGTGKYAGATGTLTLTGSWAIASASKGSKPATPVTLTLVGTITTK